MPGSKRRTKRGLNQYSGTLTAEKIAEGINAAAQNAGRLAADARLLFDSDRYPSAMALAILSIEESGKTGILRGLAAASDEQSLRSAWRDYRTHTKKNVMWPIMFEVTSGARRAGDFAKLFDDGAEHPQLLDAVKQVSLCTDCVADCQWWIPEKVVDAETTKFIVRVAELMVKQNIVTTEEIELWIAILRPHWNGSDQERAAAVCAWDKEMRRRGLIKGDVTMEQFFRDGIPDPGKP